MFVRCRRCGRLVYVGYSTRICGACGYSGASGWEDLLGLRPGLDELDIQCRYRMNNRRTFRFQGYMGDG